MIGFHALDWLAVATYLAIALAVGLRMTRRASRSVEDFYLAGRTLPWWIAGTSLVATSFAADTPLVVTGLVREEGVAGNWLWWGFAVGGALSFTILAAYWRRLKVVTDAELIERRYSGVPAKGLRALYGGYHALVTNTIVLAWVLLAMLKVVKVILQLPGGEYDLWIVFGALGLAMGYSVLSGLWGVAFTDLFQFIVAMIGAVVLAWVVVRELGGLSEMNSALEVKAPEKLRFFPHTAARPGQAEAGGFSAAAIWTQGFMAFLVYAGLQGWANKNADGGGHGVQRYSASRTEEHARGAALWFHIAHYALRSWPWILVALGSLLVIRDGDLPLLADGQPDHELAYPMMMVRYLGDVPGLYGLVCVGFLAAFMSTLDTHFNLGSAYLVNDLYRRFLIRGRGEVHYVWMGRLFMILIGLVGATLALWSDSILDLFRLTLVLFGGLGPALLLRWFWWRANAWTEISALATSTLLTICVRSFEQQIPWPAAPFNDFQAGVAWDHPGQFVVIFTGSVVVMLLATFLTPPVEKSHLNRFYLTVKPVGVWRKVRTRERSVIEKGAAFSASLLWISGFVFILGLTLLIGALLLGQTWQPYAWATWLGFMVLVVSWRKAAPPALL